ncbi:chorismate mutase [Saccharopolyspora erythraea NRRL 2338]|uniref:Chorismate mutase n=1 Tax=Saccharopolyspora erythraea (strain ATCC 11635 / DSM 40517 / JCM 4748 / NBRC 13426 / NCIMB 8594 / NRRL 2338) TaxID=405948 RepID=A4FQA3_SACEN|nr:chorismate mutase [Saccharopolyspora erythraea]EQD86287.1 chorismate mutase [Saccharopolyspora erythraea D]PFG92829.1 chorismate mutase [Saccharopolyspora erythraea NRRL 2338]QRK89742.1 chorismate mutase [Saccharopolyspora erythraea]CAM06228.1 chorismate mutase [Saccharopolyspora erythraea NRRL 2338]
MRIRSLLLTAAAVAALTGGTAAASPATDASLVPLVETAAQRVATADQVAAAKWGTDQPIDDPAREQQVLDAMSAKATGMGIDPEVVERIFRDQIEANKLVQHGLHAYWAANPAARPTERPDLGEIRPVIDRLNNELLEHIRDSAPLREHPSCGPRLTGAYLTVGHEMRLDALHGTAVGRALPSVCEARR